MQFMKDLLAQTTGSKTRLAGLGLLGLAFFQITQGDYVHGLQSGLAGLAALGLRHAIDQANPPQPPQNSGS